MTRINSLIEFFSIAERLKSTLRYNSLRSGRKESSAEHSWRLALMSFMIAQDLKLDISIERVIKLALVHDIAEAIAGDIDAIHIAEGSITKEEKAKLENDAINQMTGILDGEGKNEIKSLWQEYEDGNTQEAKYIKALDKIETLLQLTETGYKIFDKPQFIANYADKSIENFPKLKEYLVEIKKRLKIEFKKGGIEWRNEYNYIPLNNEQ